MGEGAKIVLFYIIGVIYSFISEEYKLFQISNIYLFSLCIYLFLILIVFKKYFRETLIPTIYNAVFYSIYLCIIIFFAVIRSRSESANNESGIISIVVKKSEDYKMKASRHIEQIWNIQEEDICDENMRKALKEGKEKEVGILKGLIVGDKNDLNYSIKQSFRNIGTSHTLALSGLHVGIIWAFISLLLSPLSLWNSGKKIRLFLTILILAIYSFITGMSSSVVRASMMITILQINSVLGRKNNSFEALIFAAFIIILISPHSLKSAGFQLSFLAVLGIIIITPTINKISHKVEQLLKNKIAKGMIHLLIQSISISIACQIFTLPIILLYFNYFPQHFIIANIAVIPLTTIVLYCSFVTIITSPLPILGKAMIAVTHYAIKILLYVVDFLST